MSPFEIIVEYINTLSIDFFAVPIETRKKLFVAMVSPESLAQAVKDESRLIEFGKYELFARYRRIYNPIVVNPILRPVAMFETSLHSVKDIPKHCNSVARGWEIVVAQTVNGLHVGDSVGNVDVIWNGKRVECKIGRGKLYFAGTNE